MFGNIFARLFGVVAVAVLIVKFIDKREHAVPGMSCDLLQLIAQVFFRFGFELRVIEHGQHGRSFFKLFAHHGQQMLLLPRFIEAGRVQNHEFALSGLILIAQVEKLHFNARKIGHAGIGFKRKGHLQRGRQAHQVIEPGQKVKNGFFALIRFGNAAGLMEFLQRVLQMAVALQPFLQ